MERIYRSKQTGWRCAATGLAILISLSACAQLVQGSRFEEEIKQNREGYSIINMHSAGLALIRDHEKYEGGKKIWQIALLDTALQKNWDGELALESRWSLMGYEVLPDKLFLLFRSGETNSSDLHLVEFTLNTREYRTFEIKHQVDLRLTHFCMTKNEVLLGGYVSREPAVAIYSLSEKQLKVVPGFFLKDAELLDVRVNQNETFNVVLAQRGREENNLVVRTFDGTGAMLLEDVIKIDPEKTLLTGISSTLLNENLLVTGTFALGSGKTANGIFSTIVNPFAEQKVNYVHLAELQHFVDYMGEKRSKKIKDQAAEQHQKGKGSSYRCSVALIRLHESSNSFVLLAEGFQASSNFSSNPYWQYPYNYNYGFGPMYWPSGYFPRGRYYNSPYSYNPTGPDQSEVRMHNTAIILFNNDGELLWDHSLTLDDLRLGSLEQTGDFIANKDSYTMAYKQEGQIFTKKVFPDERSPQLDTLAVKLSHDLDVLRDERKEDGGIRHWYKDNFFAWGYQTVKNQANTQDQVRNVFYINKVGSR